MAIGEVRVSPWTTTSAALARIARLRTHGPEFPLPTLIAAASYVTASTANVHPTGMAFLDHLYPALVGGIGAYAGSRASRGSLLWLAVVTAALCRGSLLMAGALCLLVAVGGTFPRDASPVLGSASAALSVQVLLHLPPLGFQGATAVAACIAIVPLLVSSTRSLPLRVRQWATVMGACLAVGASASAVAVGVAALMVRTQVDQGSSTAQAAIATLKSGNLAAATTQLKVATAELTAAGRTLNSWWTAGAAVVPVVAQQRRALTVSVSVAHDISAAAETNASAIDFSQLHVTNGAIDLAAVRAIGAPLNNLDAALTKGSLRLASVASPWQLPPIASKIAALQSDITKVTTVTKLASMAVHDAPSLLGADGTRRYFVGFLDPAESRGLGGLLVWYGELTATNGHIQLTSFGDAGAIAKQLQAKGGGHLSGPPSYLARYGQFKPQDTFIDVPYSPDLPTVTSVVSQLYQQVGHHPIDGMLILDAKSVASILSATGPLQVAGLGTLNGANTEQMLLEGQYAKYPTVADQGARKAALADALKLAAGRLTGGTLPGLRTLVGDLAPDVATGDLLFWSLHPTDQALLYATGLAGAFPKAHGGDLLSFITQNAANNKTDAYMQRSISDNVEYNPATGAVQSTVTATLHNSAPDKGLSPLVIGSYAGSGLAPGSNLVWFSVYSPLTISNATVNGKVTALTSTPELGVNTYSGYVDVPSGATARVIVTLHGVVGKGTYNIVLHNQPMVLADHVVVNVTSVGGGWHAEQNNTWLVPTKLNAFRSFRFKH